MTLRDRVLAGIERAEKLCKEATPGRWFAWESIERGATIQNGPGWLFVKSDKGTLADAEFCAVSRSLLPGMLRGIRAQVEEHGPDERWSSSACFPCSISSPDEKAVVLDDCPVIAQWAEVLRAAGFLEGE